MPGCYTALAPAHSAGPRSGLAGHARSGVTISLLSWVGSMALRADPAQLRHLAGSRSAAGSALTTWLASGAAARDVAAGLVESQQAAWMHLWGLGTFATAAGRPAADGLAATTLLLSGLSLLHFSRAWGWRVWWLPWRSVSAVIGGGGAPVEPAAAASALANDEDDDDNLLLTKKKRQKPVDEAAGGGSRRFSGQLWSLPWLGFFAAALPATATGGDGSLYFPAMVVGPMFLAALCRYGIYRSSWLQLWSRKSLPTLAVGLSSWAALLVAISRGAVSARQPS